MTTTVEIDFEKSSGTGLLHHAMREVLTTISILNKTSDKDAKQAVDRLEHIFDVLRSTALKLQTVKPQPRTVEHDPTLQEGNRII